VRGDVVEKVFIQGLQKADRGGGPLATVCDWISEVYGVNYSTNGDHGMHGTNQHEIATQVWNIVRNSWFRPSPERFGLR
jgi:hypothetical protein